ncbi:Imm1 family immunity protein [Saccharothrix tamanrassetensis]
MDGRAGIGAILFAGPRDMLPSDTPDLAGLGPDGGVWVTRATNTPAPDNAPPLYIDKATLTQFPRSAALPLTVWRRALHELATTGLRPPSLQWQTSEYY